MAPRKTSSNVAIDTRLPIEEIVFSCDVCQATVPEVYATQEHNQGFHSGSGSGDGVVTKFWIASCSHLTCGRHLAGGAAPFHPQDVLPQAACPVCVREHGDNSPKELFGVRGLAKGQYDEAIPDQYLQCPPIRLDTQDAGMDALRFQYSHIVRYARQATKRWKSNESKRRTMERELSKERKQWVQTESELKARIAILEKGEAKLQKWEKRREMINHYLGLVTKMGNDMNMMRNRLVQLGCNVPEHSYSFEPGDKVQPQTQQPEPQQGTRQDSATTLVNEKHRSSSSSHKRKYSEYEPYADDRGHDTEHRVQGERAQQSRQPDDRQMMPPPLPRPNASQRPRPPSTQPDHQARTQQPPSRQSIQAYDNGAWHSSQHEDHIDRHQMAPPSAQRPRYNNSVDHGALPFRPSQRDMSPPSSIRPPRSQNFYPPSDSYQFEWEGDMQAPRNGLISMPPRRRGQQRHYASADEEGYASQAASRAQETESRISHHDPVYRPVAQKSGEHAPREMAPPSSRLSQTVPRAMPHDVSRLEIGTPSRRRAIEPPTASVASAFFQGQTDRARSDTIRPPVRGTADLRHQFPPSTRDSTNGYRMAPTRRTAASSVYGDAPPSSYAVDKHYVSQNNYRLSGSQSQRPSSVAPDRNPAYVPQTPRLSQEHSQRPSVPPPSAAGSYAPLRPSSQMYRNRISLPPPSSRVPLPVGGSQDPQLASIRGVRGAGASQTFSRQTMAPASGASRSLFSAAGGRRSVIR